MNHDELNQWSKRAANWATEYHAALRDCPVRAPLVPGAISRQLPPSPPEAPEPMTEIFADFDRIVPPGITHWQHPRFFAYFPANAAPVSVIAESFVTAMAAQCKPAAPAPITITSHCCIWFLPLNERFSATTGSIALKAGYCPVDCPERQTPDRL